MAICKCSIRICSPYNRTPTAPVLCFFDSWLTEGDAPQYCKGLIASVKIIMLCLEQSCQSCSQEMETFNIIPYNPGLHLLEKTSPERLSSTSLERPFLLTNACATTLQGTDTWIHLWHLRKAPCPDWTCTPTGDLKGKISRNRSQWQLKETAFPRRPG